MAQQKTHDCIASSMFDLFAITLGIDYHSTKVHYLQSAMSTLFR